MASRPVFRRAPASSNLIRSAYVMNRGAPPMSKPVSAKPVSLSHLADHIEARFGTRDQHIAPRLVALLASLRAGTSPDPTVALLLVLVDMLFSLGGRSPTGEDLGALRMVASAASRAHRAAVKAWLRAAGVLEP